MLFEKRKYYKRKVVGGNLLGNLWNATKNAFSTFSKFSAKNLPIVKHALTPVMKSIGTKALEGAAEGAKTLAKTGIEQLTQQIAKPKVVPQEVKQVIAEISTSPQVKQVLTKKAKDIIENNASEQLNDNSRELLSNIIAGSGNRSKPSKLKPSSMAMLSNIIRGSGLKRIV